MPAILAGRRLERGQRVLLITHQIGLLAGFTAGGVLVAGLGTHTALAVDAGTFAVSALLIRLGVQARPAANSERLTVRIQVRAGARLIWSDRRLRTLVGLGWLAGFAVVPEGLAASFAAEVGAGVEAVGWLLAADPAGMVLGAWLLGRLSSERRLRLLGLLGLGTTVPLLFYLVRPSLAGALLILGLCPEGARPTRSRLAPPSPGSCLTSTGVRCSGFPGPASSLRKVSEWPPAAARAVGSASAAIVIAGVVGTVVAVNARRLVPCRPDRVAAALTADR